MMPFVIDNESTSPVPLVEYVLEATNPYASFFPDTNVRVKYEMNNVETGLNFEFTEVSSDFYLKRITYFLNEFSRENQIVNRWEVSDIIYGNKVLLGMIEKLVAEVSEKYSDKIDSISMWPMSDEESDKKHIFLTFRVGESVSVSEAISIETSVKSNKWFSAFQAGLTFAFV